MSDEWAEDELCITCGRPCDDHAYNCPDNPFSRGEDREPVWPFDAEAINEDREERDRR